MIETAKDFYKSLGIPFRVVNIVSGELNDAAAKKDDGKKVYVHMLNSTLIATERAMCCVLENYQTKEGIKVPPVLQEYMGGVRFIPFVKAPEKPKKGPAPPQYVPTPAQLDELDGGRLELQKYMDQLLPTLNEHLNSLARDRPADPVQALAQML